MAEAMRRTWEENGSAEHADWLRATLGVISGNRNRTLRLEAKHDGVHGMIAGGTGSGKSEILMTLIVSLAMNYSPDILNFVLVDYKGGGAFKAFESLPHCVDIVTNLNKAAVNRMFTSINAEIRRRQKMNADT
jgi:DNA segregation ATPase FtsK/SpoIIIE-like protein